VSGRSAGMPGPPVDVAAAVRRGQRRFILRLAATWVLVLAVTTGLVAAGVWARNWVHPPVSPVLAARLSGSTVVLSWTSHEPRAVGFVVLRDGAKVGRTTGRTFEDRAAPPGRHSYRVRAVDAGGHRVATSNTVTVTVPVSVTGISPASGTTAGGTTVTITGNGFTGATGVHFGTAAATGVTIDSRTQITATSPPGTGTVDITVITPAGTSAVTTADQYTYFIPRVG
jgi:IPT/TIG domain